MRADECGCARLSVKRATVSELTSDHHGIIVITVIIIIIGALTEFTSINQDLLEDSVRTHFKCPCYL